MHYIFIHYSYDVQFFSRFSKQYVYDHIDPTRVMIHIQYNTYRYDTYLFQKVKCYQKPISNVKTIQIKLFQEYLKQ